MLFKWHRLLGEKLFKSENKEHFHSFCWWWWWVVFLFEVVLNKLIYTKTVAHVKNQATLQRFQNTLKCNILFHIKAGENYCKTCIERDKVQLEQLHLLKNKMQLNLKVNHQSESFFFWFQCAELKNNIFFAKFCLWSKNTDTRAFSTRTR